MRMTVNIYDRHVHPFVSLNAAILSEQSVSTMFSIFEGL